MNKVFVNVLGASALLASAASFAGGPDAAATDNDTAASTAGFYVNGNVGYGMQDISKNAPDLAPAGSKVNRGSFVWSANAGYQFNQYIAAEAGYMSLPESKVKADNGNTLGKAELSAITLVAKGIYPINEQFDVFGKAGVAFMMSKVVQDSVLTGVAGTTTTKTNRATPMFGLGVDYNVNENVVVTAQAITTLKNGVNVPATYTGLVGVGYKFS